MKSSLTIPRTPWRLPRSLSMKPAPDFFTSWITPTRDWLMTDVGPPDWPMTALPLRVVAMGVRVQGSEFRVQGPLVALASGYSPGAGIIAKAAQVKSTSCGAVECMRQDAKKRQDAKEDADREYLSRRPASWR